MNDQDIYHRLRREIDERMPVGMPPSHDGSEIALLEKLFTEEEARIAVNLSALPEPLEKIHKRITKAGFSYSTDELDAILVRMMNKGLIQGGSLFPKPKHYSLAQFAIGIYEFQIDRQDEEFVRYAEQYSSNTFFSEFFRQDRPGQMRTIPVGESLQYAPSVSTYDDIRIIAKHVSEPIVVMDCVCKQSKDLVHDPCKLSDRRNTCFMFGNFGTFTMEKGIPSARILQRNEFITLLGELEEAGYVLQPQNIRKPHFLCACCGCCCNLLLGYKMFPRPADFFQSNFMAEVNSEKCNSCEECVSRCQMEAIAMENGIAVIDEGRCIGCGNCASICSRQALTMKTRDHHHVPAKSHNALYQSIMMKKVGVLGTVKLIGKTLAGMKI